MDKSEFPSFDDFLSDVGDDRRNAWFDEALHDVRREVGFAFNLASQDDAKRFMTAMTALNQRITILMLRDYHDWLCKQLSQRSLRLL